VVTRVTAGLPVEDETEPTVALPTGRGGTDETVRTAVAPPVAPSPPRRLRFAAAALGLALLGVAGWLLLKPARVPLTPAPPPALTGPAATLGLDAFPWGRIVSVRDPVSGRRLDELEGLVTPRRLSLPPGRWEIAISAGNGPEVRTLTVDLAPGSNRTESVAFTTPGAALPLLE
jgi:hypothetical protein